MRIKFPPAWAIDCCWLPGWPAQVSPVAASGLASKVLTSVLLLLLLERLFEEPARLALLLAPVALVALLLLLPLDSEKFNNWARGFKLARPAFDGSGLVLLACERRNFSAYSSQVNLALTESCVK